MAKQTKRLSRVPTIQVSPVVPAIPTETQLSEALPSLDYEAEPFFGSIKLERGFIPDPYMIYVDAGGDLDTSNLGLDCGFATSAPTFAFSYSGGASETFLRIFFAAVDNIDATLVIYTPNKEWLCADNSTYGSGLDPVIDIEYAPSGQYVIWVGAHESNVFGMGSLYITGSMDVTP